jgi:hypothetical protein
MSERVSFVVVVVVFTIVLLSASPIFACFAVFTA